jgi:adenosine deaminase
MQLLISLNQVVACLEEIFLLRKTPQVTLSLFKMHPGVTPFVQNLPKLELHVHIEGTLTPSLRWKLAKKNHIPLPYDTYEELESSYKVVYNHRRKLRGDNGNPTFLEAYYGGMEVLRTASDFEELGMDYLRKAGQSNVRYAESFFDPQAHTRRGVPLEEVMTGLRMAKQRAKQELSVECQWIMCFLRDESPEDAMGVYERAMEYRDVFVAVGLDSDEYDRPPSLFAELFRRARADGLRITCHCDVYQKDTHEHIRQVIDEIGATGADRIDHGLNAADQPGLIQSIKERGIGMTLCPHAYHRHEPTDMVFPKIRRLFDEGIPITINSDDPTYMHMNWVEENLELARTICPFSDAEMIQLQRNAVEISWAHEATKKRILEELDQYCT